MQAFSTSAKLPLWYSRSAFFMALIKVCGCAIGAGRSLGWIISLFDKVTACSMA